MNKLCESYMPDTREIHNKKDQQKSCLNCWSKKDCVLTGSSHAD